MKTPSRPLCERCGRHMPKNSAPHQGKDGYTSFYFRCCNANKIVKLKGRLPFEALIPEPDEPANNRVKYDEAFGKTLDVFFTDREYVALLKIKKRAAARLQFDPLAKIAEAL